MTDRNLNTLKKLDFLAQLSHQGPGFNYNKEHILKKFHHPKAQP